MRRRGSFRWTIFLVAVGVLGTFHVEVLMPALLRPLIDASEPKELDVQFLPDTDTNTAPTPDDKLLEPLPKLADEKTSPPERQKLARDKPDQPEPPPKPLPPPPEVATLPPPKPPEEKKAPEPPPPPPPELPKQRMKMVDQDRATDEKDNPDAHYLAQKNHRVTEETRSNNTNLVRELPGEKSADRPSSPSDNKDEKAGDADRKVAELEDHKGRTDRLPRSRPLVGEEGQARQPKKSEKPGKLAMRDLTPRSLSPSAAVKPREGLERQEEGVGTLPSARQGSGGERAQAARKGGKPRVKLNLDALDYDRIVGFETAEKERRQAARGERSHTPGHWDKMQSRLAMVRSSLENFTPEVKPGNQSELGTRAHPFAAYIAEMHRPIHKLFAYGFLADLDGKGMANAYNDMSLWVQLEIVLKADGSLDNVKIVRTSGNSAFDIAALDSVAAAAPFPAPPQAIRSANGKVYLDWRFHRDDRQCGTFNVDPHILTTVGDNQDHDTANREGGGGQQPLTPPRVLRRPSSSSGSSSSSSSSSATAPASSAPTETPTRPGASSSSESSSSAEPGSVPDGARDAAEGWFAAFVRGDTGWLAGWSAVPFSVGGTVVASDSPALKKVLAAMLAEATGDRRLGGFAVLTAAGIRARVGGLPPGGEGDGSMFFAVGRVGTEDLVLQLKKADAGWRVSGLNR